MEGKKTYTGIAVALLAFALNAAGIGGETEAAELVNHFAQLSGLLFAIYGRYKAKPS